MPLNSRTPQRDAIRLWLAKQSFTHFVTLATNNPMTSNARMRDTLREWDARVNRKILGSHWLKKPDERIQWIAFPEAFGASPHWHMLLQLLPDQIVKIGSNTRLADILKRPWQSLIIGASVDVQTIHSRGALDYATKAIDQGDNAANFITSSEFIRQ